MAFTFFHNIHKHRLYPDTHRQSRHPGSGPEPDASGMSTGMVRVRPVGWCAMVGAVAHSVQGTIQRSQQCRGPLTQTTATGEPSPAARVDQTAAISSELL